MTNRRLTAAQRRALLWLPADGAWTQTPRSVSAAVDSLWLYHCDLIDHEFGAFGPREGWVKRVRLTTLGCGVRAAMERETPE